MASQKSQDDAAERMTAAAEARAEHALADGRFAAIDREDNTVDVSNPAYVGVDDQYKTRDALPLDPEVDAVMIAAREDEENRRVEAFSVGHTGTVPLEAPGNPTREFNDDNRAVRQALAAQAREQLAEAEAKAQADADAAKDENAEAEAEKAGTPAVPPN